MKYLAVALLVIAASCVAMAPDEPQTDLEYVCEQVQNIYPEADCTGLEPPVVVVSSLVDDLSWGQLNGAYYPGESYIFINPNGTHPAKTIIHEMTHYVLDKLKILTMDDRCEHEAVARFVAGQDSEAWKGRYGCEGY